MYVLMSNKRRLLTIIVIIFLILSLPTIMYVISTRQDIRQRASENVSLNPAFGKTCEVNDIDTLISCFGRLYYGNDQVDVIKFTAMVNCNELDNCEVSIPSIRRPVLIYGDPGTEVGIKSTGTNSLHVFSITNSDNVDIKNIQIIGNGEPCPENRSCSNGLTIGDSTNIRIDNVTVRNAKRGIGVYYSDKVTITNSTITNNDQEGIHVHSATDTNLLTPTSGTVFIENNIISDNRRYGIFIEGIYPSISPSHISGNILDHNHTKTYPGYCISDTLTACGGGQITIKNYTSNIVIENNIIRNGSLTTSILDTGVSGIELGNRTIQNIQIRSNDIHDNSFWGISSYENTDNMTNNTIQDNRIYNNAKGTLLPSFSQQANNCTTSSCPAPTITGTISPTTNFTSINATGQCQTTISWSTNASTASIYREENLLSNTTTGSQLLSTIPPGKTRFDLLSGTIDKSRLASTVVYCFASPSVVASNAPSNSPTQVPLPTVTPTVTQPLPTPTLIQTLTPAKGTFSLSVILHGIGNNGDNTNKTGGNLTPRTTTRTVSVELTNTEGSVLPAFPSQITYQSATQKFVGEARIPQTIPNGTYSIRIKSSGYLSSRISGFVTITDNTVLTLPVTTLTVGDTFVDNKLDILDFNIIMTCWITSEVCSPEQKILSDLDDDGNVTAIDDNLFIREITIQRGY